MYKALWLLFTGKPSLQTHLKTYKHLSISLTQKLTNYLLYCREERQNAFIVSRPKRELCLHPLKTIRFFYFFSWDQRATQLSYDWKKTVLCTTENITRSSLVTCQTSLWWLPCFHCTCVGKNYSFCRFTYIEWIATNGKCYFSPDGEVLMTETFSHCQQLPVSKPSSLPTIEQGGYWRGKPIISIFIV